MNQILFFLFQVTGHEDGDDADQSQNKDTDSEIEIDEKEKKWAYALTKENLLDSDINEKLVVADLSWKLKDQSKKLGKQFKIQKRQYGELSNLLQNDVNVVDASKKIRHTRLEIYKEMQNLIDLENDFSKNAEDTDMKNIFGVRLEESVDVITIGCRDFKCTQCAFRKKTCGAVESHM